MFNFAGISHIVANPSGHAAGYNYRLVGSVPLTMLAQRPPTTADVMGGRVQPDGFAYVGRPWATVDAIVLEAKRQNVKLCQSPTCACRELFPGQ